MTGSPALQPGGWAGVGFAAIKFPGKADHAPDPFPDCEAAQTDAPVSNRADLIARALAQR